MEESRKISVFGFEGIFKSRSLPKGKDFFYTIGKLISYGIKKMLAVEAHFVKKCASVIFACGE